MPTEEELRELEARRAQLRDQYLKAPEDRRADSGARHPPRGLICSDVEQTIQFYQGLLGFPLVELVENRDYNGSTHFFFDLGNQTLLGFFDFPGLGLQPGVESIGSVQHIAISAPRDRWEQLRAPPRRGRGDVLRAERRHRTSRCTSRTRTASRSNCSATR